MTRYADRFFWKPEQWQRAQALATEGKSIIEIAEDVKLKSQQVFNKFMNETYSSRYSGPFPPWTPGADPAIRAVVPQWKQRSEREHLDALEDRDRRADLRAQQSLTQSFFGDPPPGYSALCKKARAEAR